MTGFQHSIAGGNGNLVITSVQSPNFVHGSAGWQIRKDGSAEFSNLTIRGTFNGTDYILNSSGLFFYSTTPAPGVPLIGSWAPVATTDPFGTSVPAGLRVVNSSGVGVALTGTTLSLPGIGSAAAGFLDSQAAPSASTRPQTLLSGPSNNDQVAQLLLAGESTDASALATIILQAFSLSAGIGVPTTVQVNGQIVATQPGVAGNPPEIWHTVTLPAGMTGSIRVKLLPYMAVLDVAVTITSTLGAPSPYNAGSLPAAAYYPTGARQYPLTVNQQYTLVSNAAPRINIPASGALQLDMPGFSTAGVACIVSGTIVYPLD